jgi:hypothetical protein
MMKTAGIVIDAYKLDVFTRHLTEAGFEFTTHAGPTSDTLLLKVKTQWASVLEPIVKRANDEASLRREQSEGGD